MSDPIKVLGIYGLIGDELVHPSDPKCELCIVTTAPSFAVCDWNTPTVNAYLFLFRIGRLFLDLGNRKVQSFDFELVERVSRVAYEYLSSGSWEFYRKKSLLEKMSEQIQEDMDNEIMKCLMIFSKK